MGIERQGTPDHLFQYNGKEKQEEFGLNLYDFEARMYDAQLGRFHAIDPHSDTYWETSPYAFVLNNPLRYSDPTGMDTLSANTSQLPQKNDVMVLDDGSTITMSSDAAEVTTQEQAVGATSDQQNDSGTLAMIAPLAPSLVVLEPISFASLASLAPVALVVSVVAVRNPTMTGITPGLDASARYTNSDWSARVFSKAKPDRMKDKRRNDGLSGYPTDFKRWAHQRKQSERNRGAQENYTNDEIDELYQEWKDSGKPKPR